MNGDVDISRARPPTRSSNAKPLGNRASPAVPTLSLGHFLRKYAIFLVLAGLIFFFQSFEHAFLRFNNLFSVLQSVAVVALLGIGVTVTLAVDGFDLSVGSIAAFTLMLTSYAMVVLQFNAAETVAVALVTLGGVFVAARVGRGDVFAGSSLLLDSVAAALIGFAVLNQRRANVIGTAVGAVFVGIVLNGLTMLNVPYYTQDFVKGLVLVGALALTFGIGRGRR
jgi:ribose/xylose/arabinose/galactoside ABC-type transport system permease subunit